MTAKRVIKKTIRIVLWILGGLVFLVIGAIIFLNTNYAKRLIRDKAQSYLQNKIKSKVTIGSIDFSLPKWIEIKNVYIEDQQKDTLLFGEKLAVDISMLKLISGNIYIQKVELDNIKANLSRTADDSVFNYQFIADAFSDTSKVKVAKQTDTSAMNITLKEFIVNGLVFNYKDNYGGNVLSANIKNATITFDKLQPDRMVFNVNKFETNGLDFSMSSFKTPHSDIKPKADTASKNNLLFTAKKLDLHNINVAVDNKDNGMFYGNHFQNLIVSNTDVNLATSKVGLDKITLDSSSVQFIAAKATTQNEAADTTTKSAGWVVTLKNLELNKDEVQFDNNAMPQTKEGLNPAHIHAKNINIHAAEIFYSSDSIKTIINQLAFNEKSGFTLDSTHARILYSAKGIAAAELYIKTPQSLIQNSLELKYDNIAELTTHPKNTTVNADLLHTKIAVNDIYMLMPAVEKYMPKEKFRNNNINLNTKINGTLQQLNIPVLQVSAFSGSTINAKAILFNVTDTKNIGYDITVFNSHIPKTDLQKFLPANPYVNKLPPVIDFGTHLKGNLKNTTVDININSNGLKLNGTATAKNLNNPKALQYNVNIKSGTVTRDFITAMVPPNTIPANIQLPDVITLKGTAKGDENNIEPNLTLGGTYGDITAKGYVHNFKNKEAAQYDIHFTSSDFAAGKLLKQDSVLGNITMSVAAKGKGFNYKTMHSAINMQVQSAEIMQYNYTNVDVDANLDGGIVSSNGSINSGALKMQYEAKANISTEYPSAVDFTLVLDTLLLQQLHLYKDTLNAAFKAHIKGNDLNPKNLSLSALIDSIKLNIKNQPYALDSISLIATTEAGTHDIAFKSQIADVDAKGKFDYDKIGQSILQYINKYYNVLSTPTEKTSPQEIAFSGVIKNHTIITGMMPGLVYDDIHFKGGYSSNGGDSALNLHIIMPKINYQTYVINNGKFDLATLNNEIDYETNFDELHFNKNIFYASSIKGDIANDSLNINATTKDIKKKDRFTIGAAVTAKDKAYTLSLKKDLLLNYQKWNVADDNKISYSPEGILVKDFVLENNKAKISINSKEQVVNSPIEINIENFEIKDIATITNSDTLLASGVINSKIEVNNFKKNLPEFTGDISISTLNFMQQPIGDLKITADEQDANTVNATLDLTGAGNKVNAKGKYYLNNADNQFDINLVIDTLKMATLQAFTAGNMARSSGSMNGKIDVNGNLTEPKWNGAINFDSAKFTVAKTGATYVIDKQKIALAYPTITFNDFTILDSAQNELSIDGTIKANSISNYNLDFNLYADNFILVNTAKAIDNQVYGFAAAQADVNVSGTTSSPDIEGDITVNPKSDVTIVLPEQNINKDAARSVVRFIDRDTFALPEKIAFMPADTAAANISGFLNYNLNLDISKTAALTIVVDPTTGDVMRVKGDAKLNAGVDPGGNIVLAGNYELDSGYYVLNYQFLQKQFNLVKGSTIDFSGSPMNAQVDITAEYIANTSASDLLDNEISNADAKTANTFNQKIPFRVLLYLKGPMKKPNISFDIQLPDENSNVPISSELRSTIENKLIQMRGDVATTNKEVFSLLILGRFVSEQSSDFFKSNGASTSANEIARESVSKFLSSAMQEIASDLVKGVDIDLNLNSYQDFSSGDEQDRTDLNVAVSKSFLSDRLTVTAGKNFGVSGEDAGAKAVQQNAAQSSFPDLNVNYKLSEDGKYIIRAYKKDQFDVTVDGYVTETGVGFVLTLDYDHFKELFQKKDKTKKTKKTHE